MGVCRPVLRILTLFPTKKCHFSHHFPHPFSDLEVVTKRNMRVNIDRNYVIITEIRTLAKGFLSYSFIIERTNKSIRYRSSLVNDTRFQTKMGKIYIRFQTKTAPKPYPLGRQVPRAIWLIKGSTPPPGEPPQLCVTLDE